MKENNMAIFKKKNQENSASHSAEIVKESSTPAQKTDTIVGPVADVIKSTKVDPKTNSKATSKPGYPAKSVSPYYINLPYDTDYDSLDAPAFPNNHTAGAAQFPISATPHKAGDKIYPPYTTYTPKPLYEKRSVIILVVESSPETLEYQTEFARLIGKIVADNSNTFFKLIRYGNSPYISKLTLGEKLQPAELVTTLLTSNHNAETCFDIYNILISIETFVKNYITFGKTFEFNLKPYMLEDARIVFIGTGKVSDYGDNYRAVLKNLCENAKIKTVKYFCPKDEHTIKAAAIGFPIIGHIESNFYK
jgi:hypothetical protein